ncbi:MAG: DUF1449 family protein [Prosthecobacter sp.]|uniref:OB-fold-containig protein n=1 Tax=Prosthecobacter sp. TaxID=1965333 RepID=UPI0019F0E35B|nr:OB-fold-containig protein [Prosthecobacter sp.]MBE2286692.1 DUF1449 family protein [Prosthecobacter sp.]
MIELFNAAIAPHQVLLTLLLALVVCYWLLVILGALDFEADLPDADLDLDSDGHHAHHGMSTGGVWITAGRLFGFSQVPIVVWLSFLFLFMWFLSLVLNEKWNPSHSILQTFILLLPNLVGSLVITKLVTIPVARLFKAMADSDTEAEVVIGRTGTVCSIEADETYGQLEITANGAPLLINVRTQGGTLVKGTQAKITSAGPDNAFYFIESV